MHIFRITTYQLTVLNAQICAKNFRVYSIHLLTDVTILKIYELSSK